MANKFSYFISAVLLMTVAIFASGQVKAEAEMAGKPKLLGFYAKWCAPCKNIEPLISKIETKYSESIDVIHVDIDDPKNSALVNEYSVSILPSVVFVAADGQSCVVSYGTTADDLNWGLRQLRLASK
jgi:thiol-disulfide isomerase/thioredoxin